MKTVDFMGTTLVIPDNVDFRYDRPMYSHHCRCIVRSRDGLYSENFTIDMMDSISSQKYKINLHIDKLQSNMNSPSIAALGAMNSNPHARLHVQSSHPLGYGSHQQIRDELDHISNQVSNVKKQKSKKLLLLK